MLCGKSPSASSKHALRCGGALEKLARGWSGTRASLLRWEGSCGAVQATERTTSAAVIHDFGGDQGLIATEIIRGGQVGGHHVWLRAKARRVHCAVQIIPCTLSAGWCPACCTRAWRRSDHDRLCQQLSHRTSVLPVTLQRCNASCTAALEVAFASGRS